MQKLFFVAAITSKHAEDLATVEQELTRKLEETNEEKRKLEENMNSEIEEKVEVC